MNYTRYFLDNEGQLLSEVLKYKPSETLQEIKGGAASYALAIRGFARSVWQGLPIDVFSIMWDTVGLGIEDAWRQGAASCGVAVDELTLEERIKRDMMVNDQRNHIMGFLDWCHAHRRDGPDKYLLRRILARAATWGNRWNEAYNMAKVLACSDQKLKWLREVLRKVKKSCHDCTTYDGRIYRASVWQRYDIRPQHPGLGCKGFLCACGFEVTDEKCTPGRPPRMTGT